jgi:hypothetical protein
LQGSSAARETREKAPENAPKKPKTVGNFATPGTMASPQTCGISIGCVDRRCRKPRPCPQVPHARTRACKRTIQPPTWRGSTRSGAAAPSTGRRLLRGFGCERNPGTGLSRSRGGTKPAWPLYFTTGSDGSLGIALVDDAETERKSPRSGPAVIEIEEGRPHPSGRPARRRPVTTSWSNSGPRK